MRRLDDLLETKRTILRLLSLGPASAQVISENTGLADTAVWLALARLEEEGFVRSDWTGGTVPRPPRTYRLTTAGQRIVDCD